MRLFLNPTDTQEYYISEDTEKAHRFTLRPLSTFLMFKMREAIGTAKDGERLLASSLFIARFGIVSIEGIELETEQVDTPYGPVTALTEAFVLRLHPKVLSEVSDAVLAMCSLSEQARQDF